MDKYTPPLLLGKVRFRVTHYQFLVVDPGLLPGIKTHHLWTPMMSRAGYFNIEDQVIFIGTEADSNTGVLEAYWSAQAPSYSEAERAFSLPMTCRTGRISFGSILDIDSKPFITLEVPPGNYLLHCLGYNLGANPEEPDMRLSETAFCRLPSIERFKIFLQFVGE